MNRASEIKYAVASDNTVIVMRNLAYRDGVKDALKIIREFIYDAAGNPPALTVADHLISKIKKECRKKYK